MVKVREEEAPCPPADCPPHPTPHLTPTPTTASPHRWGAAPPASSLASGPSVPGLLRQPTEAYCHDDLRPTTAATVPALGETLTPADEHHHTHPPPHYHHYNGSGLP
ncbi:hypothetical protein Hamer_G027597 [Homarus americanus]|uniref:Uncharacterized protein n=1 Tax=Homarus americanus TaxID=6706 RepID=A0A8J5N6Q6_HOMAM|nr:hypothetical protein Hamer_G027597 [Homarus americanus]